ncbi:MAG: Crp/Fnr family transcriptional regulator [Myxococcaceae bacterium]
MATSPLVKKLSQIPICRGLKESETGELFAIAEETTARKGNVLFHEGDEGDALYIVLEGHIDVTKKGANGVPQSLAKIGDGSVIGEMSLMGGNAARSATATASSDVKLLKVPATRFSKLLRDENVAALKVVHNLAQVMSHRLQLMDEKLVDLLDKGKKKEELADFQRILNNWAF